ncbi:hypothetical protein GCM10027046_09910 [Uliginosibacterium flavum]|uniref:histidine kinase n=1 Tax=Uliginosibacterium flavum TaxID=1396831 RepID=A0ABV2TJK6_9RHOO
MTTPAKPHPASLFSLHIWRWPLLAALGTGILIAFVSQHLYREAREATETNLSIIAELKAHEIERWVLENRSSMMQPASGILALAFTAWQSSPHDELHDGELREVLNFYQRRHIEIERVDLYDTQGHFLISSDRNAPASQQLPPSDHPGGERAGLVDFYLSPTGQPRLGFTIPLTMKAAAGTHTVGFALLEINPKRYLFDFLQSWPMQHRSGETVLLRPVGDEAEVLNSPPNNGDTPARPRLNLSKAGLSAAQLDSPESVLAPGRDYHGVEVLRVIHPVEGTPWKIASKIDAAEVYAAPLRGSLAFSLLLCLLLAAIIRLLMQGHNRALQNAVMQQEQANAQVLRAFIEAVPESLFMLRRDGAIKLINHTGAARLGSTPEALIGSNMFELLPADIAAARRTIIEQACCSSQPITLNDSRSGVEYLSLLYPLGDDEHVVVIAMDVSARNADARALQVLTRTLQSFIDHLPGTAYVKDHESRVLIANQGFKDLLGLDPAAMIGKLSSEIFPGEFGRAMVTDDLRILASGQTEVIEEMFDGRYFESTKFIIPREDAPPLLGGLTLEVTSRHQAEEALRQSEENLRRLTDNLPNSYLYQVAQEADASRHIVYVSSGVERIFGLSPQAVIADLSLLLLRIDPAQMPAVREAQARALDGDFHMDLRMLRADGGWGWIAMHSRRRPGLNETGQIIWDGVATDVTDQRRDEELLALQARRASALLELPQQAERLDEAAFMAHAQDVAEQLTGSQIAFVHFVHEDQEAIELAAWSHNTLAHYCTATFDKHYPISQAGIWADSARHKRPVFVNDYANATGKRGLPEGHSHLQRLISVPVMEGGLVRMIAGVGNKPEDYTDTDVESVLLIANETWRIVRKQRAEQALAQTIQVIEASPVVCFRWRAEADRPVSFVSDNVRRWGYLPADLMAGKPPFSSLIHPEDLARVEAETNEHAKQGHTAYTQEYRLLQADGSTLWVSDLTSITRDALGQSRFIDGVLTDVSERKAHEIQLTESLTAQQALNKKLEEAHNQLLQSEKLAGIGQLAAGVAHELNNPIGFVHSNLGTLTEYVTALISLCDTYTTLLDDAQPDLPQLTEIRRIKHDQDYNYLRGDIFPLLEESREGLARVRKIVQDLRDFSRTGNQDWAQANLHKGLDSTLNIVANELKYKCTVRKEYAELPEVYCVISQINQVFMNLLVNAAQAIENNGEIVLRSGLEGEDQVWISISDSGHGIPPEMLNRIFDPFFTTKPVGVGTGLGLSLVFGIINRHHGRIEVSSKPGQGSTFRIVLPINPISPPEAV